VDFYDITKAVKPLIEDLDHAHLGAWETSKVLVDTKFEHSTHSVFWLPTDFNPTSENLLVQIGKRLLSQGFTFSYLQLDETPDTECGMSWTEFQRTIAHE
jgi:6-pyruvoyl-tetrahydropterin synthase